jgi:hypothetical protein
MKRNNLTMTQKIGFTALGLVAITIFTIFLSKKATELRLKQQDQNKENENTKPDIVEGFNIPGIGNIPDPPSIDDIGDSINDALKGAEDTILGPILKFIKMIEDFFDGYKDLGIGISNHIKCGAKEANTGAVNGLEIFSIILECMWDKNVKFWNGTCTRYYIVDMIVGIFYGVFIELPLLIIYAITGFDMKFIVDLIIEIVVLPFDSLVYVFSGYHITEWPDSVIKNCYRCEGSIDIGDGNGRQTTYRPMGEWGTMLNCTTEQFNRGLGKIFASIVPSTGTKWTEWYNGHHLSGGDDYPPLW